MPTTPPQSAESAGVRPPRRTAGVTGVPSTNSGHCAAIPGAVLTLWEPATRCADTPSTTPATVLPTPRIFLYCRTLRWCTDLDQRKTTVNRTLGAPPSRARRTVLSTATDTPPTGVAGCRRDPRMAKEASKDDIHARRHTLQCPGNINSTLLSSDSGKDEDFSAHPVHVLRPSLCL